MEILEGDSLSRILLQRYLKEPRDWNFVISPSRVGFFKALVYNKSEAWQLKFDSIFKPTPIILGAQTEPLQNFESASPVSFGYRRLDLRIALALLRGPTSDAPDLMSIMSLEPIVPREGGSYAKGPFVFTNHDSPKFSDEQKALDERLSSELRRRLQTRYPSYA